MNGMLDFLRNIFAEISQVERNLSLNSRFSSSEILEMVQIAKKENLPFLQELVRIKGLTTLDISFLLMNVKLTKERIATIKEAILLYDEEKFKKMGQTFSDYIFKIVSNIEVLENESLSVINEIIQIKNDVYDLKKFFNRKTPLKRNPKRNSDFAFEKVLY